MGLVVVLWGLSFLGFLVVLRILGVLTFVVLSVPGALFALEVMSALEILNDDERCVVD